MSLAARLLAWLGLCLSAATVSAHEVRPAYLELDERTVGVYQVTWKVPLRGDRRLALAPLFSGATQTLTPISAAPRPVTRVPQRPHGSSAARL